MTSKLISIFEERDVADAEAMMKENKIRHLPVMNSAHELLGILSVRDVAKVRDKKSSIKSVMSPVVKVVKKSTNIKSVIEMMLKHKISSVLVASNEDIVGIVTTDDLLQLLSQVLDESESLEDMDVGSFFDESWKSFT
jgi:CBS domain-containing protein